MTITLDNLSFLQADAGQQALDQLSLDDLSDTRTLPLLTGLRKTYSPEQAGALLEMARLRQKAAGKFDADAARMFFTRAALEQASDPRIRRYRAGLVGAAQVLDFCCGIGSDALAFAAAGAQVTGVDHDPVRVAIAGHNAGVLGLADRAEFVVGDVADYDPSGAEVIFFDPARRDADGDRIFDVERYEPPLSLIRRWSAPRVIVKLSPGVQLEQLAAYRGMIEFMSVDGDLKEAVLHTGSVTRVGGRTRATLLHGDSISHWDHDPESATPPLSQPQAWLVEPDPALLRAGLVQAVAAHFDGAMLDETIAYFTCAHQPISAWVRAWQIVDWMPFNLKKLRAYLREHQVGNVTVKKRGVPITPEELIPQLKLKGTETRTLVLTRFEGVRIVLVCLNIAGGR